MRRPDRRVKIITTMSKILTTLLIIFLLTGCSFFSPSKMDMTTNSIAREQALDFERELWPLADKEPSQAFVKNGKVINAQKIKQGGNILVLAFRAGENVQVDDGLDRTALLIIRGITEIVSSSDAFEVIFSEEESIADFIIDGHIIENVNLSNKKLIFLKAKSCLKVKGKMIARDTAEVLAVFEDELTDEDQANTTIDIAEQIGQNIGLLILSALNG